MGPNMLAICAEQLKEFLKAGWIYRGAARTAAPVLMVRKPNADATAEVKWRVTIDYRKLNNVIRKKAMDLPTLQGNGGQMFLARQMFLALTLLGEASCS